MDVSSSALAREESVPEKSSFLYRGMRLPFLLIVICFAAWGLAGNLTDPLVSVFGSVFSMSALQASLVQFAYYGAYFALAVPAAWINSHLGYKGGVLIGLLLAATGGILFLPASQMMTYSMFLVALFTLAAGLSILETSANPYVMAMGPRHNATRRLNFAQSFNPVGSNLGVLLAAIFILPNVNPATAEQRASLTQEALAEMQSAELQAVMGPYLTLALVYVVIAIAIAMVRVPRYEPLLADRKRDGNMQPGSRLGRLVRNRRYAFGVVAQFFNVAAQTCTWTFTIHYVIQTLGVSDSVAGYWLQASLLVFLVSRFVMVGVMGRVDPRKLMTWMCVIGVVLSLVAVLSGNLLGAVAVVSLSACISLLFPTIYGISLEGLGQDTKYGAAGLVMAIVGGALMPLVQGWVIDITSARISYVVVALCFAVIAAFGVYVQKHPRVGEASDGDLA
ncbi:MULTISPECIES: L-fucose:H+ symporter permease [Chromohalobacter]|jgi:FHS family L-fucose permease-like MFS transporter|uniref:L-fucose permease n=1 Tax=Chromohalobacter israelensis (strain ATCC BAA-138 / DSM 3043 / CIP 106854 / NCIMB 13768 / 1H11) TaxID=290398 RepID=Q1R0N2_CHRI1|nr:MULTISPECIES: L-fucose:H+ symporter permease [Chromohalobacter]ABE57726.1 L-fucose permease [Chromohalobacter salexigens DSM 3043]MDO0945153.1 L-fucose:H+ symporter permease [Chromohalobacter salexigens]RXE46879.1 L-fucose:H+ symporter permease [Chromohalobacter salexigens]